ncbi:MAG: hypothetical protein ABII71_02250 [Candidatus Micrarchaeota archaeon]
MAIDLPAVYRYCKKPLARKEFRYDQLVRRGIISGQEQRKLEALRFFKSGQGMKERFIGALNEADESFADDIRRVYQMHEDPVDVAMFSQICMLEHGVFADFNRPNSSGIVINSDMVGDVPVLIVLGEINESDKNVYSGRVTLDHSAGIDSAVVYATAAIEEMTEMFRLWLSPLINLNRMSLEAQFACWKDEPMERKIDEIISGIIDLPDVSTAEVLRMWSDRKLLDEYREIKERSDTPEAAVMDIADLHLRSAKVHELAHLLERKANRALPNADERWFTLTDVHRELFAYLIQACFLNSGLAFRMLTDRKDIDLEFDLSSFDRDIDRLGLVALLEDETVLRRWAFKELRKLCSRFYGMEPGEIFDMGLIHSAAQTRIVTSQNFPLIEEAIHHNPELNGKMREQAA